MKQAINTRTQEEYDALMEWRKENGQLSPESNYFTQYKENTCVLTDDTFLYGSRDFYECLYYTIIPYTEFAKANIVEEPDYKAWYLEGRKLLEEANKQLDLWSGHQKLEVMKEINQFLTNHKDGE